MSSGHAKSFTAIHEKPWVIAAGVAKGNAKHNLNFDAKIILDKQASKLDLHRK